jgi:hypothetical protein
MDPAARARVQRRRSTMLKLMPVSQELEDGASPFEPEWGQGDDHRNLMNAPDCADGTISLFYQLEEAGVGAAEEFPPPAPLRDPVVAPPSGGGP